MAFFKFPSELRARHALIVEADRGLREDIGNSLRYFGLEKVTLFGSGFEARKSLHSGLPFDLVLMELMLPGVSGLDLIRFIRKEEHLEDLPILVMTDEVTREIVQEVSRLGISGLLLKPISTRDIAEKILNVLRSKAPQSDKRLVS
ncbi:MAG: response regulator [bacterium]